MPIEAKARDLVAEHLCVEPEKVTDTAVLIDDLGADSLDIVELQLDFEDEFGIYLTEDEMDGLITFGDAVRLVADKIAAK